ncbi:MAG: Rha family transcriptional regulator [Campylobacterota bacterium]
MKEEIIKTNITKAVNISKNDVFVSSDFIAEVFDKRHSDVLSKIRNEIEYLTAENIVVKSYFQDTSYINSRGKEYKRYNLTRKGFDAIVLSFTGDKARRYKYWFIGEFHRKASIITEHQKQIARNSGSDMWQEIRGETKKAREALTDAIQTYELPQRIAEGKASDRFVGNRVINYTQLISKVLDIEGIPKDALGPRMLFKLEELEYSVAKQIQELTEVNKCHYKQTYQLIKKALL